jgi:hypothetical protein
MGRPYQIFEKPIMIPYVCIQCGVGAGQREWFLDLGFAIDHYFDTDNIAVYLCNECYHGMTLEVGRLLQKFRIDHEKWDSAEKPSYSWMEAQLDVRESKSVGQDSGVAEDQRVDATTTPSTDRDDQDSESNNPEPESSDSGDAESTDDSDPDAKGIQIRFGSS